VSRADDATSTTWPSERAVAAQHRPLGDADEDEEGDGECGGEDCGEMSDARETTEGTADRNAGVGVSDAEFLDGGFTGLVRRVAILEITDDAVGLRARLRVMRLCMAAGVAGAADAGDIDCK
jgi:hypothetical protein